ncbi:hypothetical protein GCM10022396_32330 [Flavivirga amylovorans]
MYFITAFVITYTIMYFVVESKNVIINQIKYKTSGLTEKNINDLYEKIEAYLKLKEPYIDPKFSISKLSEELKVPTKHISQAINSKFDSNFNDYVNKYRLEKSKELLKHNSREKLTISEIYYMVGFNSKSTFNILFKKTHGMTPTQFRKEFASGV